MQPQTTARSAPSPQISAKAINADLASSMRQEASPGREERILDDDGHAIVVKFPGEPTVETYEFLKEYLEFRIQRLSRAAKKVIDNGDA